MNDQRSTGIGRRDFLMLSGAAVTVAALGDRLLFADTLSTGGYSLPVGFASAATIADAPTAAIEAAALGSGDGSFVSNGVRISVQGYFGAARGSRTSIRLLNRVTAPGAAEPLAWDVWSYGRGVSSPTRFDTELDGEQKITLALVVGTPSGGQVSRRPGSTSPEELPDVYPIVLSLKGERGSLTLRRGYYLISIDALASRGNVSWYGLRLSGNPLQVVDVRGAETAPSTGDFVLIGIDYVRDPEAQSRSTANE